MGLSLSVGILPDLIEYDEDGAQHYRSEFAKLSRYLQSAGLAPHNEPETGPTYSGDMYGYGGLHCLRRLAAHLDLRGELPEPGDENASKDSVLDDYGRRADRGLTLFGRLVQSARHFDHLIVHSDAEGFYVPQDFAKVLIPCAELKIPGGMVGSSHRLLAETKALAEALGLPLDLDPRIRRSH